MEKKEITEFITPKVLTYIEENLNNVANKFGIDTKFTASLEEDYRGKNVIYVKSGTFNTLPRIFSEIFLDSWGDINENNIKNGRCVIISFSLHYRFKYFDGGGDNTRLCNVLFKIKQEFGEIHFSSQCNFSTISNDDD